MNGRGMKGKKEEKRPKEEEKAPDPVRRVLRGHKRNLNTPTDWRVLSARANNPITMNKCFYKIR